MGRYKRDYRKEGRTAPERGHFFLREGRKEGGKEGQLEAGKGEGSQLHMIYPYVNFFTISDLVHCEIIHKARQKEIPPFGGIF